MKTNAYPTKIRVGQAFASIGIFTRRMLMKRTQIVQKTKLIAKRVTMLSLFRLILLIFLEMMTAVILSLVFSTLGERIAPNAVVVVGPFAVHVVSLAATLVANLFLLPLTLGLTEYLLKLVRKPAEARVSEIFLWFSDGEKLKRVFSYFGYVAALSVVTLPLSTVPTQYLLNTAADLLEELQTRVTADPTQLYFNWSLVNWPAVGGCIVAMLVAALLKIRLFLTPYLFVDDNKHGAFAAAAASWKLTKGHVLTYIWMMLTFVGWYLLTILTGFVILLYVLPYVQVATVILGEYIRAEHRFKTDGVSQSDEPSAEV